MPFKKGQPKPPNSGRKREMHPDAAQTLIIERLRPTPGLKLHESIIRRLEELGCDPIQGMVEIAMDARVDINTRARMFAELAQYAYPKRRAIEHSGFIDSRTVNVHLTGKQALENRLTGIAARIGTPANPEPVN